ncbi:hypothetical protein Klosneuvirus_1_76 [Klosneuvirus KNV1]|uniref:MYM-type domain-containing protein n=1 Tax=Klosneuvirus KNV1 TaxID=1977640 RepID=A0A1V0SHM2_9VIRU|nr:hypothetical protein Klosneuvirus_1_76 [Klosneuvirus KNV1]
MDNNDITSTDNLNNKQFKRGRGRPRKNQIINYGDSGKNKQKVKIISSNDEEPIILQLPISLKEFHTLKNNTIFEKESKTNDETPEQANIFTINDIDNDSNSGSSLYESDNLFVYELKKKIKDQEGTIKSLEKELNNYKDILNDSNNGLNNRKVSKMNINFINSNNGQQIIVEKTNIACWYCSYNFDTIPCFIPEKFYNDKYYVFGCFCTYNCAASYNLKMDDSAMWYRYSLLKKLYNTLYNNNNEISLAPPREAFDKFGGPLKYEDYLKNSIKCLKEFRFIMPPMTSIVPLVEEHNGLDSSKVNISLADLNKKKNVVRSKPLPNMKNTLLETLVFKESK